MSPDRVVALVMIAVSAVGLVICVARLYLQEHDRD